MSDESVPIPFPLSRPANEACEATSLYRELRKPLIRYLVCLGMSNDEAQDIVQDAFLSLHRHLASDGSKENIRGWLFRVVHNEARNHQRSYGRRFVDTLDDESIDSVLDEATPERLVFEKERFRQLEKAMSLLTESERCCLLLRAGGLRYREIGEVLGIPTSTVADTVDRTIRKLAEKCSV